MDKKDIRSLTLEELMEELRGIGEKAFRAKQVYEWLHKYTVESDLYVIIDEYDEIISFDDFVALVEKKQSENNPDDFTYSKNMNGYRFSDGEFR